MQQKEQTKPKYLWKFVHQSPGLAITDCDSSAPWTARQVWPSSLGVQGYYALLFPCFQQQPFGGHVSEEVSKLYLISGKSVTKVLLQTSQNWFDMIGTTQGKAKLVKNVHFNQNHPVQK